MERVVEPLEGRIGLGDGRPLDRPHPLDHLGDQQGVADRLAHLLPLLVEGEAVGPQPLGERRLPHNLTLAVFDPQSGKILTTRVEVLPPPK